MSAPAPAPAPLFPVSWADTMDNMNRNAPPAGAAAPAVDQKQDAVADLAGDLKDASIDSKQQNELHPNDATAEVVVEGSKDTIYKAAKTFDELGLSPNLLKGVLAMNFTYPSKIQAQALPIILSAKHPNLCGQAQHGSGKTAAYSLGMLSRVDPSKDYPQALCLCPVRELALQVTDVVNTLGQYTGIKAIAAVPGITERNEKIKQQIIVGTAGTIQGQMRGRQWDPSKIRILVLDEADVLIDEQAGQVTDSMNIKKSMPRDVQVLLFSATFPDRVLQFANKFAPDAVKIIVKTEALSLDAIQQYVLDCENEANKYPILTSMYGLLNIGSSIIFVHTIATAKSLANQMRQDGFKVSLLHGRDMKNEERDSVMKDFRENRTSVLITTNVLSRGVDVLHVNVVINYEMPMTKEGYPDPETYIHRVGRSGRFGRKGVAINFVHDKRSRDQVQYMVDYFRKEIKPLPKDLEQMSAVIKAALGQ